MPDVVAMCPGCRQQFIVAVGAGRAGCPSVCGNAAALWWALGLKSGAPRTRVAIRAAPAAASATRLGAHSTVMRLLPPLGASTVNPGARNQPRGAAQA